MLYCFKIRQITRSQQSSNGKLQIEYIYNGILSILHRIVVLTIMYWVMTILVMVTFTVIRYSLNLNRSSSIAIILQTIVFDVASVTLSISMFMMLEHNTDHYVMFLRILKRFRLITCCCCCYMEGIELFLSEYDHEKDAVQRANARKVTGTLPTQITQDAQRIEAPEISVETVTAVVVSDL